MLAIILFNIFTFVLLLDNSSAEKRTGLLATGSHFTLNRQPFRIFSGSMHYFRVPQAYWRDRLVKMKACGLNTVQTYVPWNVHEKTPGNFTFDGNLDLPLFLETAEDIGLKVILRPGPFICADWDWGGLPAWLLKDPHMIVRSLYPGYVEAADAYFARLIPSLVNYQYQNGGPIIAVQIGIIHKLHQIRVFVEKKENEYGTYGSDQAYLTWAKNLLTKNGIIELLFTCDPPWALENGTLPGVFTVVNFGGGFGGDTASEDALKALKSFQPDRPLMVGEFWSGWSDVWGAKHHVWNAESFGKQLEVVLQMNASINFYMFQGGTSFGFMNGADRFYEKGSDKPLYTSEVTSYDYNCPISEAGWITQKYLIIRELLRKYNSDFPTDQSFEDLVETSKVENQVGKGTSTEILPDMYMNLTTAMKLVKATPSQNLQTMEYFGQSFGFIAYRTRLPTAGTLNFNVLFGDRLLVILDQRTVRKFEHQGHFEFDESCFTVSVPETEGGTSIDLILLVENMGRVNYELAPRTLQGETKGLSGMVFLNGEMITAWKVYKMDFDQKFMKRFLSATQWSPIKNFKKILQKQPVFYKAELNLTNDETKQDYFVSSTTWSKGVTFINKETLGRYWNIGPQRTLYLPKTMLRTQNTLVMFELEEPGKSMSLVDSPDLGPPCEMPCFPW